jgi:hypothetical protein
MKRWTIYCFVGLVIFPACNITERERAVEKKEQELAFKEQQLNVRELALQQAEAAFAARQHVDSSFADSVYLYQQNIAGAWATKMTCTETTCPGSAVGDTKNETWTFSFENNKITARASVAENIARVYTGKVVNDGLELVENIDSTATAPATKLLVSIKKQDDKLMEGQRQIIRADCRIVYSLQLSR